jgi:hypothetical protein
MLTATLRYFRFEKRPYKKHDDIKNNRIARLCLPGRMTNKGVRVSIFAPYSPLRSPLAAVPIKALA